MYYVALIGALPGIVTTLESLYLDKVLGFSVDIW